MSLISRTLATSSLFLLIASVASPASRAEDGQNPKALEVIEAAIEAMGGEKYLNVKNSYSRGRWFMFDRHGRKSFSRYQDWTVYEPIKSRFQLGEGKRQVARIHNLEAGKGWSVSGEKEDAKVEEIPAEEMERFKDAVKRDLHVLLRQRVNEPQLNLYYWGPEEIAGTGEHEAVEFLDATNMSVVVFFDRKSKLPAKLETTVTNRLGIREKHETEYYNWHTIQGVHTPLRIDDYVDEKMSSQLFIEEISYNIQAPPDLFLAPQPEK